LTEPLSAARARTSSRLAPPPTPVRSIAIHAVVLALWLALFALAFGRGGPAAWSVGLLYLAYDTALQIFTVAQSARMGRTANTFEQLPVVTTIAVLIAARDEATALPGTLQALLAADEPPEQILIADDGSCDETATVLAERFGLRAERPVSIGTTTVALMPLSHRGKAAALNTVLTETDCAVVLTVDADTVIDRHAIRAVRQAFSVEPELMAVSGVITPVCRPSPAGAVLQWFQTYEYIRNFLGRHAWMQLGCLQLISGAFAGFRRPAVIAVGGFDEDCLVEDYELIARMQRYAGERALRWRFRVLGAARARTEAPGTVAALLRQRRRWFGGFLQTQWWYRAMVGDRRFGTLGTIMLPVKAVDTVAPLYGLTGAALLIVFLSRQRYDVLGPVLLIIVGKIAVDAAVAVWSVRRYRRWIADPGYGGLISAAVATVLEPLSYALLLQTGALLGWLAFLRGTQQWGRQQRFGMTPAPIPPAPLQ